MILVILGVVLLLGIIGIFLYNSSWVKSEGLSITIGVAGGIFMALAIVGIIVSTGIFCVNYIGVEGDIAEYQTHYDSLKFQIEHNLYKDDITKVSIRELVKEIQHWNCDLAEKKINQYNTWIGIFIPDIYDQFEFISLDDLIDFPEVENETVLPRRITGAV